MKKRGRRWVVVAGVALAVAILVGSLVYREPPPYEFLRGTRLVQTTVMVSDPYRIPDTTWATYVSDLSVREVSEMAEKELAPMGWGCNSPHFISPDFADHVDIFTFGLNGQMRHRAELRGRTGIVVQRLPTTMDRFSAWIDRLMRR